MIEQVMVYEVKSTAADNAKGLFSNDEKYFYWNDSKFRFLNENDYVFIVNTTDKWVLLTKFLNERILTEADKGALISRFSHKGKVFEPRAPDLNKLKQWENFIHLEVLQKINFTQDWAWKSLGNSETTYLNGPRINQGASENRITNIEQLKMLSKDSKYQEVLNASHENFVENGLNPIILEAVKSDNVQKVLSDPDFHFQVAQGKLKELEDFSDLDQNELKDLLERFSTSKDTYSKFILKLKKENPQYELFKKIGEVISYCDLNAADKNTLNEYDDKRILARSNVRQTDWVKWLMKYKLNGFVLDEFPPNIKNALKYLKNPNSGLTMLSENHREQTSKNLLGLKYDSETFLDSLKNFFKPYSLTPKNPLNYTRVISNILYEDEVKKLWDLSSEGEKKPLASEELSFKEIIQHAHRFIESKGFRYDYEDVANFYLSLKTKPFIILAGISGTGKTQLPRKFADAVGMNKDEQIIQVPVRPDWTDSSDLIGYTALDGNFVPKPLTEAILRAKNDQDKKPYFFILDEMNLARVEHYFSDFLSIIETRELKEGQIVTDVILRDESFKTTEDRELYGNLTWPENLFLIGTVNMDETTHAFSRKVLDRANSIEMNSINLDWIKSGTEVINSLENISSDLFYTEYIESRQLDKSEQDSIEKEMKILMEINEVLEKADLHFAYRVRDEVAFYLILNKKYDIIDHKKALDFQLMQKVLPRIHGSSRRIYYVLLGILGILTRKSFGSSEYEISDIRKEVGDSALYKYPKSIKKTLFMLERFDEDRFTSFWV